MKTYHLIVIIKTAYFNRPVGSKNKDVHVGNNRQSSYKVGYIQRRIVHSLYVKCKDSKTFYLVPLIYVPLMDWSCTYLPLMTTKRQYIFNNNNV